MASFIRESHAAGQWCLEATSRCDARFPDLRRIICKSRRPLRRVAPEGTELGWERRSTVPAP